MSIWLIHETPFYRQWPFQVKSAQDFVSINSMQESHCRCTSSFGIIFISWLIASFKRNPTNPVPFLQQKHLEICSLKLTTRTRKIDVWKTILSFFAFFQVSNQSEAMFDVIRQQAFSDIDQLFYAYCNHTGLPTIWYICQSLSISKYNKQIYIYIIYHITVSKMMYSSVILRETSSGGFWPFQGQTQVSNTPEPWMRGGITVQCRKKNNKKLRASQKLNQNRVSLIMDTFPSLQSVVLCMSVCERTWYIYLYIYIERERDIKKPGGLLVNELSLLSHSQMQTPYSLFLKLCISMVVGALLHTNMLLNYDCTQRPTKHINKMFALSLFIVLVIHPKR